MTKTRSHVLATGVAIAALTAAAAVPAAASPAPAAPKAQVTALAVKAAPAASVTTAVSPRSATSGQTITFSGRAPANATMVVQYKSGKTWKAVAGRGKASKGGSYKVAVKHVLAGNVTYRVAAVVGKKTTYSNAAAVSLTKPAQWYWLANYTPASTGGYRIDRESTAALGDGTHMYTLTEYMSGDSTGTWRLNGTCSRLSAFAGSGSDGGTRETQRQVQVLADGASLFAHWFAPGEGQAVDVSLRGARSVTVAVRHKGSSDSSKYGLGAAKILCTAPPGEYDPVD